MKRALTVFFLTLVCAAQTRADDFCAASSDQGTLLTVRSQSPFGPGTSVIIYPNGIGLRWEPDKVAFIARSLNGKWVDFGGNYAKGEMNGTGGESGGSVGPFELTKAGDQLIVRKKQEPRRRASDPPSDPGYSLRVTTLVGETGKLRPAEISTLVQVQTAAGGEVAAFTERLPWEVHQQAMDTLEVAQKNVKEALLRLIRDRSAKPSAATADFAEGETRKARSGCKGLVTDFTGQNGGGTPPTGPAGRGG